MSIKKGLATFLSFAHLAHMGQPSAARIDESDDEPDDPEPDDESKSKGKKAKKAKKAKVKNDDGDDADASEDDEADASDDDDADAENNDDEDDKESEMSGKSALAQARRRERARCAAIMASKAAGRNPALAANLAFNTSLPRSEALIVLEGTPPPTSAAHTSRSARNPDLGTGGNPQADPKKAAAASWDTALQKASGKK